MTARPVDTVRNPTWRRTADAGGPRLDHDELPTVAGALRVLRAGICGTDLQIQRGVRPDAAAVLGHEGLVEYRAEGGELVRGIPNPVDPHDQDSILGHSYDGLLRRWYPAGDAAATVRRNLVPARPDLPADLSALTEPLGAVLYGWDLVADSGGPPESAVVWGSGTTAVLTALVAELRGTPVTLVHPRAERLAYLRGRRVLETTVLATEAPAPGAGAAFVCLPREAAGRALGEALHTVRENAAIDLFGGFGSGTVHELTGRLELNSVRRANVCGMPDPGTVVPVALPSGKRVRLTGHRGTSARHLLRAQELLTAHPRRFGPVLTHVIALADAGPVLRSMAADRPGARLPGEHLKVLVDPALEPGGSREADLTTTVAALPPGC
ncbi:dehydrogenase [Streptomyces sp. NPDC057236]|uniref:dehydrogenase n=1 Tax=Streptomyces sp. NPDC057236 TaxID=3346059 RepID=UPI0036400308